MTQPLLVAGLPT